MKKSGPERFGDRIDIIISEFPPGGAREPYPYSFDSPDASAERRKYINNRQELFHALERYGLSGDEWGAFNNTLTRKGEHWIKSSFVDAIISLYPQVPRPVLMHRSFAGFEAGIEPLTSAQEIWRKHAVAFASSRPEAERSAMEFFKPINELNGRLPLVGKTSWIMDPPLKLGLDRSLASWSETLLKPPARLDGTLLDFVDIKARLMERSERPFNGITYRLNRISGSPLEMNLAESCYFDYVNGLEINGPRWTMRSLSQSDWLPFHGDPAEIFRLDNRPAAIGVNCILLIKDFTPPIGKSAPDHRFAYHVRDNKVLEAQNTVHVVPAGTHQPVTGHGLIADRDPYTTLVREFLEEIFGINPEKTCKTFAEFLEQGDVRAIMSAFAKTNDRKSKPNGAMFLLGLGLDPVTTKPELLCAIVLNLAQFRMTCDTVFDWERETGSVNKEGKVKWRPLSQESLRSLANNGIAGKPTLPAGAACMLLAADRLEVLLDHVA